MRIVIVGGGVIGTSVAWHLAQSGKDDISLIERDRLGSGTSWHSAGNITWKPSDSHDAPILYMLDTVARLEGEHGLATGWLKTGRIFLAHSPAMRATLERFDSVAGKRGIPARFIDAAEARALHPLLDASAAGSIWHNSLSGRLNPADLVAAYATAARRAGATVREGETVLGLETTAGRISGVRTSAGVIPADVVVLTAGLWSRRLLEPVGVALAQWPCEHFYVIADVEPRLARETPSFVAPDKLTYGREEVGRFLVGFFDENAKTIDPSALPEPFTFTLLPPDWEKIAPYFQGAAELFPALANAPIRSFINGPESFTPDGLPLIGPVPGLDGLIVATAMNSAGVTWSAMTGAIVADLVAGTSPRFDAARYDPARFGDRGRDVDWLSAQVSAAVSSGYLTQNR